MHRVATNTATGLRGPQPAVATLAALLVQWAASRLAEEIPYPVFALGDRLIRETPGGLATRAIDDLGSLARALMVWFVVAAWCAATWGAAAFVPSRYRVPFVAVFVAAISALALAAAPVTPAFGYAAASVFIGAASAAAVALLIERPGNPANPAGRRRFVVGALGGAVLLMVWGSGLASRERRAGRASVRADSPFTRVPDPEFPQLAGLTPLVTAPDDHYTVDINLSRPRVDGSDWRLSIDGLVREAKRLTFSDLLALETTETPIHLHCISNIVAGDLMGNATWVCVALGDVLELAGPEEAWATMIVDAADGYRGTLRHEEVPGAWLAVGMGGEELPDDHGFPVRLLLPGRYGMRSVKWVTGLRLVPGEVESYWAERGWDALAPLRTGSRIDVPEGGAEFEGTVRIAGLAWAAGSIDRVELSHNGGASWSSATLEHAAGELAWRRWYFEQSIPAGEYEYTVRAVSAGVVQGAESRPPHPSGASGYHRRTVRVT